MTSMTGNKRKSFREALRAKKILFLPVAHDALSARIIEESGFTAFAVGGYAVAASLRAYPDIGLLTQTEMAAAVERILGAVSIPALVDADDGYGDVLNIRRTVQVYERAGADAIFMEDQVSPKRCGHMAGKRVIEAEAMVRKLRAAAAARTNPETIIMARTDARATHGLDELLRRCQMYLEAGADALFPEAPQSREELRVIGREFGHVPLVANLLERGRTPLVPADELAEMGYKMITMPTTLVFTFVKAARRVLRAAVETGSTAAVLDEMCTFDEFTDLLHLPELRAFEAEFGEK